MDPAFDANLDDDKLADDLRDAFRSDMGELSLEVSIAGPGVGGSSGRRGGGLSEHWSPRGARLGDFEIVDEIGRGGMGVVYRARQLSLNREVALKVLPGYARRGRTAVQRFRTEAQAAARLHHTNIVPIYAQGEDGGRFYYAMELIDGASLDAAIRTRSRVLSPSNTRLAAVSDLRSSVASSRIDPFGETSAVAPADDPPTDVRRGLRELGRTREDYCRIARMFAEVAEGLGHAHAAGVVHRDIKPQNLLVDREHRLHITDFGLARLNDAPTITAPGEVMGTPAYLSPEQVEANEEGVDFRTDIYSLGVTLYEVLTLHRPFEGETREQILTGIRTREPAAPRRYDGQIPVDLDTICLKAMEKERGRRFASATDLADELHRFAEGRPIRSRPLGPVGRAVKWSRRHRAASVAIVLAVVALVLGGGLTVTAQRARRQRADRLLADVRQRLVYLDYRATEDVFGKLDEAGSLGADSAEVAELRGIAAFGKGDTAAAAKELESAIAENDGDVTARYLLARTLERQDRDALAAEALAKAENYGPRTAADWFFRGLAFHWKDPDEAIASYERARTLRLAEGNVFLQATLQVARARNQRMYAQRSLDDFTAAADALQQLIDLQVYGGYPYYLLSTSHRLAAQIYAGSDGTRSDDALVKQHYVLALETARKGEQVEPANPSCYGAEAFALESQGRFAEAIAAHDESIERSTDNRERYCEAHHYRWRLKFWTGDYEGALSDIAIHKTCELPQPEFTYSRAYPALVFAAQGNLPQARKEAAAIYTDHPGDGLAAIWAATWLRLLGDSSAADSLLTTHESEINFSADIVPPQSPEWVAALYHFAEKGDNESQLEALADKAEQEWRLLGEADFHAGVRELAAGHRAAAIAKLTDSYRSFDSEMRYTYNARLLLEMLLRDPAWPPWIPAAGVDSDPANRVQN